MASSSTLSVAFDATSLLGHPTGIGVFAGELLGGLASHPDIDVDAFAVSFRGRSGLAQRVPAGVGVRSRPVPARLARMAWQRIDHPTSRWLAGPTDVVHGPNYVVPPGGGAAEVVTVSDLSAIRFPEMCSADVLQWPHLLTRALARGAWVHTISEFVADEVRALHPSAAQRVIAVPLAVRQPLPPSVNTNAARGHHLAGGERYVLALGTVEPRKDLPSLVAAFDLLAAEDLDLRLVLAGPDGLGAAALTAARDAARHRNRIVRVGWVNDSQRLALLRGAAAVAYPSRYEGFGLVPLEALAVGTPVVATSVGALPEVLGDGGILVPPSDADALAGALGLLLADQEVRRDSLVRGAARVAAYGWEATVEGIVGLYRCAAAAR